MLPGKVARHWLGLCNPTEGAGISSRTLRAGRSSHTLQRVPWLPWEWRCSTRRRGGRGRAAPHPPAAWRGQESGGSAWQLGITMPRARSSPNPPSKFTPSLAGGMGTGMGMEEAPRKSPPRIGALLCSHVTPVPPVPCRGASSCPNPFGTFLLSPVSVRPSAS